MVKNGKLTAQGYRVQKIILKELVKNVLKPAFKRRNRTIDVAETYLYSIEENELVILEEHLKGKDSEIGRLVLESDEDTRLFFTKGSFEYNGFIYHVDKETIRSG